MSDVPPPLPLKDTPISQTPPPKPTTRTGTGVKDIRIGTGDNAIQVLEAGSKANNDWEQETVLTIGMGNFGTCLSTHLASIGHDVTIWGRNKEAADIINTQHKNLKYLGDYALDPDLKAVSDLDQPGLVEDATVLVFAIPTQSMRSVLGKLKGRVTADHLLVFTNKGIENGTYDLPCDIVNDEFGPEIGEKAVFLSGPSFAVEVVQKQPTAVSVASHNLSRAAWAQRVFHAPHFRVYTTTDVVGVEIAGALKNVVAIGSGMASGMGFQSNTRAATLTRGLAEISRVGVRLGADPLTFVGLAGVGDLFLTASSEKSRNFTVGYRLGQGEKLDDIVKSLGSVAEGVETTRAAYEMIEHKEKLKGVDAPMIRLLYNILYGGLDVATGMKLLTSREMKSELTGLKPEKLGAMTVKRRDHLLNETKLAEEVEQVSLK